MPQQVRPQKMQDGGKVKEIVVLVLVTVAAVAVWFWAVGCIRELADLLG